jgi:hypothetical protein
MFAAAELGVGVTALRSQGFAVAPGTVTAVKWLSEGTAAAAPSPGNTLLVEVLKGATVVASKTYNAQITANTWDALTLSAVAGATTVAANDVLIFKITQTGTCDLSKVAMCQTVVTPV